MAPIADRIRAAAVLLVMDPDGDPPRGHEKAARTAADGLSSRGEPLKTAGTGAPVPDTSQL